MVSAVCLTVPPIQLQEATGVSILRSLVHWDSGKHHGAACSVSADVPECPPLHGTQQSTRPDIVHGYAPARGAVLPCGLAAGWKFWKFEYDYTRS